MRLHQLQKMDPIQFEKFVGQLFRKMGHRVVNTQASADEGIDLVLRRGRKRAIVQCKRYQGSVGQPVIRDLYGSMLHTGSVEAYLVTTGTVTRSARSWVEDKPIHLVDGHRLVEWVRSGRLNYDTPPRLRGRSRARTAALVLFAVLALFFVYSLIPQGSLDLGEAWQNITAPDGSVPGTVEPAEQPAVPDIAVPDTSAGEADSAPPVETVAATPTPLPTRSNSSSPTE